jgi:tRNA (guanine-N7-)-methyltransferase
METGELTSGSGASVLGPSLGDGSDPDGDCEGDCVGEAERLVLCSWSAADFDPPSSPDEHAVTASAAASSSRGRARRPLVIGPSCLTWDDDAVTTDNPSAVRTFKRRAGRVTSTQEDALERLWADFGLTVDGSRLDLPAVFGRTAPVVLEIGFGMGEATAAMAAAQPGLDVLAVDVHTPGHGNLLKLVEAAELTNVRVVSGDARVLVRSMLGPASLHEVRVFFPDPWPKAKHVKRRLVTASFADLVADRLVDGGLLHVATDMAAYAEQVTEVLGGHPLLEVVAEAPWRAPTKFERRGLDAGRPPYDLAAVRRPRS